MEVPRSERRPADRKLLLVAAASAAITVLAIGMIDQPVARAIAPYEPSPLWDRGIEVLEWTIGYPIFPLVSAFTVIAILAATMAVPRWRVHAPIWMFIAGTHIFARFAMIQLKELTGRLRPYPWLKQGGDDTFFRDGVSFPSGHVVLFASLAIPFAVAWPRTRPLLAAAAFVMLARVAVNAHFISDVTGAIALVALVAWLVAYAVRPFRR